MSGKFVLLFVVAVISVTSARVTREAPKIEPSFSDFFETAGANLKEWENTIFKAFGVENTDQFQKKAEEQGKELASKLDQWANNIKKETENLKDNTAIKELRETVDKAINDFKLKNPETATEIKNFVEKANKGTEDVIGKIKSLNESEEAKNIKDLTEKLMNATSSAFQNIAKDLTEKAKQ